MPEPEVRRSWSPSKIPQYQLPDYLKYDPVLFQFFRRLNYQDKNFIAVVVGETGCQPAGSKVLMANGEWKNIEDVKIGDRVISPFLKGGTEINTVKNLYQKYSDKIYTLYEQRTGDKLYSCADNHYIPIKQKKKQRLTEAMNIVTNNGHTTTKMGAFIKKFETKSRLILDPYFLGVWLGDGNSNNTNGKSYGVRITSACYDIIRKIEEKYGKMDVRSVPNSKATWYWYRKRNHIGIKLEQLGLHNKICYTKFIPTQYKLSNYKNRLRLLSGLIDTDGCVDKLGRISYTTTSERLADDIIFVVKSLGGRSARRYEFINGVKTFKLNINLGNLTSKLSLQCPYKKERLLLTTHTKIPADINFFIKTEPGANTYGIELAGDNKYFITDNFCMTHNCGKSISALTLARAIDITPLGNGRYRRNFVMKAQPNGKATPETRVVFGPSDFLRLVKSNLPRGSVIVWDEAGIGQDNTTWNDKKSRLIKHIMQTFRSRNYGLFMTVPDKESITLATRRLVHCYIDVAKRDDHHAYLDIRWLNRVRGQEKTTTYYKYPIFKDPVSGKLKKIIRYKVPKIDAPTEAVYNRIKDYVLQNMYDYYQKEMDFMEKELGEEKSVGPGSAIKMKKFNMAACTDYLKNKIDVLKSEDESFSEAKVIFELSKFGYDCKKQDAKLVTELLREYEAMSVS